MDFFDGEHHVVVCLSHTCEPLFFFPNAPDSWAVRLRLYREWPSVVL